MIRFAFPIAPSRRGGTFFRTESGMKSVVIPVAALAVGLAGGSWAAGQDSFRDDTPRVRPPIHEHEEDGPGRPGERRAVQGDLHDREHDDHGHGRPADRPSVIRQRADALANELDNVQEHLEEHLQEGHADRTMTQLFRQADAALAEAIHFQRSIRPETPPQEVAEHFQVLDRQVDGLIKGLRAIDDRVLRRMSSRLASADEQLHAVISTGGGRPAGDSVARQAHALAEEARRLERAARATIAQQDHNDQGDHRGDRELTDSLRDFAGKVEHFHETAETEHDSAHLAQDFAIVDQSWHRVVDLMNRNPHGAYLSRRAERVGELHDSLAQAIGVQGERKVIRFNVGGIGVNLQR